jgi:hypothetical protein
MMNYTVTELRQKLAASLSPAERAEWQRELDRAIETARETMDSRLGKVSPNWDMTYYSHEIAHDLRDAGWRDAATRTRGPLAVLEFTRGGRRKWVLVDIATDIVVGGQY